MVKVVAAIIEKKGKYLIARRKDGELKGLWEFPGGKMEPGETPEESLKREISEELGLNIQVDRYIGTGYYNYPHISIALSGYIAKYQGGNLCYTDHDQVKWVGIEEMENYHFAPADRELVNQLRMLKSEGKIKSIG